MPMTPAQATTTTNDTNDTTTTTIDTTTNNHNNNDTRHNNTTTLHNYTPQPKTLHNPYTSHASALKVYPHTYISTHIVTRVTRHYIALYMDATI